VKVRLLTILVILAYLMLAVFMPTVTYAYHPNPSPYGQCTWWVWERWPQELGPLPKGSDYGIAGDAYQWIQLAQWAGWPTGTVPRAGAVAVWNQALCPTKGHVAYVEQVAADGVSFYVSEMNSNCGWGCVDYAWNQAKPGIAFIYPKNTPPPPVTISENDRIKGSGPAIFLVAKGKKHWIPSLDTLHHLNNVLGGGVKTVSDVDLDKLPTGRQVADISWPFWHDNVLLVNSRGNVFVAKGGQRRYLCTWNQLDPDDGDGFYPTDMRNISDTDLERMPMGPPIYNEGELFAGPRPSTCYVIERGKRRGIPNPETFLARGYKWGNIITLPPEWIDKIPAGRMTPDVNWPYTHDNWLLQAEGDSRVYFMQNGSKRYLASWDFKSPFDGDSFYVSDLRRISSEQLKSIPETSMHNTYFSWYDGIGARDWILMANPPQNSSFDGYFSLSIQGTDKNPGSISGSTVGQVPAGNILVSEYPNSIGGPVRVGSLVKPLVSQRVLWGDSLEEVVGTDEVNLSDHYFWPWYDEQTNGVINWIILSNPYSWEVSYSIRIGGREVATGKLAPGETKTPTFPGLIGGPVEVNATGKIIASQRVLSSNGKAFNEVPGTPVEKLSNHYLWTWYDNKSKGAIDWVLVANPGENPVTYQIKIAGAEVLAGILQPGEKITPTFPGKIGGPVEVIASANIIASQRIIWGPSFEEVPGFAFSQLKSSYLWTWYDNKSPDVTNWILVTNPGSSVVNYSIKIANKEVASGSLAPGEKVTPTFPDVMDGMVEVVASGPIFASQRVLWKGYFNEVIGKES